MLLCMAYLWHSLMQLNKLNKTDKSAMEDAIKSTTTATTTTTTDNPIATTTSTRCTPPNGMAFGVKEFYDTAQSKDPVTDKVVAHQYDLMYGIFLLPLYHSFDHEARKFKFLEIGLGCDMNYGPGASVAVWKR